jgi:hypothetical protein
MIGMWANLPLVQAVIGVTAMIGLTADGRDIALHPAQRAVEAGKLIALIARSGAP